MLEGRKNCHKNWWVIYFSRYLSLKKANNQKVFFSLYVFAKGVFCIEGKKMPFLRALSALSKKDYFKRYFNIYRDKICNQDLIMV